jgi:hypothetical protein
MSNIYSKNYTDKGYLMNYRQPSAREKKLNNQVYQFRIELLNVAPLIWRRIQVPAYYNFWDLHVSIQDSMGWSDSHLHHFEIREAGKRKPCKIGIPDFEMISGDDVFPGWEIAVPAYFSSVGMQADYVYDYGDLWIHSVLLEGILLREAGIKYPACLDGAEDCPPEDCGGPFAYSEFLKMKADPEQKEVRMVSMFTGRAWRPKPFNKDKVKFTNSFRRWMHAFLDDQGPV